MNIDTENYYAALIARDMRFDGVFFVGVSTTGIYCRPICPARTPKRDRCNFFPTTMAAEHAGFRPCLRCRPELAPGRASVDSANRTISLLMHHLANNEAEDNSVPHLAQQLGLSERQLRRVVESELGVSLIDVIQTQRLLTAKQLLTETNLPITEVAFASGFASVRRFNALFQDRYRLTPSALRANRPELTPGQLELKLAYRPPLAWPRLLKFFANHAVGGVEEVTTDYYQRTIVLGKCSGIIKVELAAGFNLKVTLSPSLVPVIVPLLTRLKHLFDLTANPELIAAHLMQDQYLATIVPNNPGLRVPGAFDGFEVAMQAIVGQQVTVKAASTLVKRIAQTLGKPLAEPQGTLHYFSPTAVDIANANVQTLIDLGIISKRAQSIITLASKVASEELDLSPGAVPEDTIAQLKEIPGIGDWTAHYIAMRALHWPNAFPYSDLGIQKALKERRPKQIIALAENWQPWRAYATLHLWANLAKETTK